MWSGDPSGLGWQRPTYCTLYTWMGLCVYKLVLIYTYICTYSTFLGNLQNLSERSYLAFSFLPRGLNILSTLPGKFVLKIARGLIAQKSITSIMFSLENDCLCSWNIWIVRCLSLFFPPLPNAQLRAAGVVTTKHLTHGARTCVVPPIPRED